MCAFTRPSPDSLVLDLTRRLAEDYVGVPLPEVARVVKHAAATSLPPADCRYDEVDIALLEIEQSSRRALSARNFSARSSIPRRPAVTRSA